MAKRQKLNERIRFDVFKRDSFRCQYCGSSAPDVVLHCDHIVAVANGGDNSITNLVTACSSCNQGKSSIPLSDSSAVEKQKRQLDELNERKTQLDMMMQWKMSLLDLKDTATTHAIEYFNKRFNCTLNSFGESKVCRAVQQYGLSEVLAAIDKGYVSYKGDLEKACNKLEGICKTVRRINQDPEYGIICKIAAILNSKNYWYDFRKLGQLVRNALHVGETEKTLLSLLSESKNWTDYKYRLENAGGVE